MKHTILKDIKEVAEYLYDILEAKVKKNHTISIALSGGNTPKELFIYWAYYKSNSDIWNNIKYFWVDERAVSPENPESNYGVANELFFKPLHINSNNIFRIQGENNVIEEAKRYEQILYKEVNCVDNTPQFDIVLLGIGDDGHTASIFPGNENLFSENYLCKETTNPYTKQLRITLTGTTINQGKHIIFITLGISKRKIVNEILLNKDIKYPAQLVKPISNKLEIITDFKLKP